MALFVYTTKECKEDIQHHSMGDDVDRFRERLLKEQRTSIFNNFPPPYMKKRFQRQFRLIALQHEFGDHLVVVFLRVLVRGERDYGKFIDDSKSYGDRYLAPLVDTSTLEQWLDRQLRESPPPEKPEPNEEERSYLWNVLGKPAVSGGDVFICESEDWVRSVASKDIQRYLVLLSGPLLGASEKVTGTDYVIPVPTQGGGLKILARFFPEHSKLFVAAILRNASEGDLDAMRERYRAILECPDGEVTDELILQYSARAYPNLLLLDDDLWADIQGDEASNLALSPEETSILESVHDLSEKHDSSGFPLFINGRAGSGKSTILQYLFSDYLRVYLTPETPSTRPPQYFTTGSELLQRSRKVVGGLLKSGHKHILEDNGQLLTDGGTRDRIDSALDGSFHEFREFLLSRFTREERKVKFPPGKYVDYARFKELWEEKFGRTPGSVKAFGADISWHVIRGFIKGLSIDGYLDSEEYRELPEKERTVTDGVFKEVYERVWVNWYQPLCEREGRWDDQDLARKLLDEDRIKAEYPAIFCDEAQDLTRLELEVLFRLSLFSERRLKSQELQRVPFAFAGDPFQTLNPTGFRWDAIKSAFVVKFLRSLDPTARSGLTDLNYKELSYNYRSTKNVVRLSNGIQALRAALFDIPDLKPQTTWKYEESSPMPVWFDRNNQEVLDQLKQQTDLTIIIPCLEGEEKDYVANDNGLSSVVKTDETGVPQNVLSATRAKGLEFNRVALWCFGLDENASDLLTLLTGNDSQASRPEELLPREYFINRLYVAASRPRRRLIVIDSEEGMRNLWEFATDTQSRGRILNRLRRNRESWEANIGILQPGVSQSWSEDREDPRVLAERFEQEGSANRDPYLLRSAALSYEAMEDKQKALRCRGFALLYEKKFKAAGGTFKDGGYLREALEALWEGGEYKEIVKLNGVAPDLQSHLESRLADFLTESPSLKTGLDVLKATKEQLEDPEFCLRVSSSQSWVSAVQRVLDRLVEGSPPDSKVVHWKAVLELAEGFERSGLTVSRVTLGGLHYRAAQWAEAVKIWAKTEKNSTGEFRDAKARTILGELQASSGRTLTADDSRLLAEYYTENGFFKKAIKYWSRIGDQGGLQRVCLLALGKGEPGPAREALKRWIEVAVQAGNWPFVIALLGGDIPEAASDKKLKAFIEEEHGLAWMSVLFSLSQSELLPNAGTKNQKRISDILKRLLIEDSAYWVRHITPDVAGAAIERAGRNIDALQFYENVINNPGFSEEQRERAKRRWLKTKNRQAKREEQERKPKISQKHVDEAFKRAQSWGIEAIDRFPEFPDLEGLTDPEQTPAVRGNTGAVSSGQPEKVGGGLTTGRTKDDEAGSQDLPGSVTVSERPIVWSVEPLRFRFLRTANRINIENNKTMETASIRIQDSTCESADVEFSSRGKSRKIFFCKSWNLECDLSELKRNRLTLRFTADKLEVRIRLDEASNNSGSH